MANFFRIVVFILSLLAIMVGLATCASLNSVHGPGPILDPSAGLLLIGLPVVGVIAMILAVASSNSAPNVAFTNEAQATLTAAKELKWQLNNPCISSLHILGGALTLESSRFSRLFAAYSITLEKIKAEAIESPAGNRTWFGNEWASPSYVRIFEHAQRTASPKPISLDWLLIEVLSETTGATADFLRKHSIDHATLISEILSLGC